MKRIYKNWFVHNVFGHPLSEMAYWLVCLFNPVGASRLSMWVHDITCPNYDSKEVK